LVVGACFTEAYANPNRRVHRGSISGARRAAPPARSVRPARPVRPARSVRPARPMRPHMAPSRVHPQRNHYGHVRNHPAPGYRNIPYRRYHHTPWRNTFNHAVRFHRPAHYYGHVRAHYSNYLYLNWIYYPAAFANGHRLIEGYPYYVYNGYRHRYS